VLKAVIPGLNSGVVDWFQVKLVLTTGYVCCDDTIQ